MTLVVIFLQKKLTTPFYHLKMTMTKPSFSRERMSASPKKGFLNPTTTMTKTTATKLRVPLFSHVVKRSELIQKKKRHCSATVKEDQEVDTNSKNIRRKKNNKKLTGELKKSRGSRKESASNDSDIEIIEKPQEETPEKELGM